MGSSPRSRTRSRSPAGSRSTIESTVPRGGEGRVRGSTDAPTTAVQPPRASSSSHQRRRSRSRDADVVRRRHHRSSTDDNYYRDGGSSHRSRYGSRESRGSSPSRAYSYYPEDRQRRRTGGDDYRSGRRDERTDRRSSGGGSYYSGRPSRDAPNTSSSLHYVNSSSRDAGGVSGSHRGGSSRSGKNDEWFSHTDDTRQAREGSRTRTRDSVPSRTSPRRRLVVEDDSPQQNTPESKDMPAPPPPPPSTRRSKAQVEFGKPIRPDPRANAQKGNVLVLACDCPRKYVPDPGPRTLPDPEWLPTIRWGQATFEERILLRREVAPRAVANARGQAIASPTVCFPSAEDSSWHETWPSDVDCRIVCVLRLPDLVTSDDTFLRAVRGAIPNHLRARDALQKAVVIKASGLGGSVVQARCGYLAFRTRRDAHECWSLRHLKLYGYVCPLISDPTAFRTLCQIALVLKLYEGNSIGATTSGLTTRHVLESSQSAAPTPSSQPGITGTKFGGGLSSRKPLPSAVRGADTNGGTSSATSRGRFVLRGLKASLERLKGPPVEACGNFTASAVRYNRLDQRDGAVIGRTEYVRAETSSDGQSQKLHIGLTKDRSVVVLETNDDNKLADWRPEWVFRDWAWGCRPMSVTQAEKKSADEEIDPAELSDYSTYSLPDMSVFKPIRPVVAAQPIGGGSPQSKARSAGTSRKSKKSKKKEKKKRRTSHDLTTKLAATEVKADGTAVKAEVLQAGGR